MARIDSVGSPASGDQCFRRSSERLHGIQQSQRLSGEAGAGTAEMGESNREKSTIRSPTNRGPEVGVPPIIRMDHRQIFPFLVLSIVLANLGMFIFTMYWNNCPSHSTGCVFKFLKRFSFQPLRENPLLGPSTTNLLQLGALQSYLVTNRKQAWRLISCIWLHGGLFHLLINMLGLLSVGIRLELAFGFRKVGLIYLLAGVGGSLTSALFIHNRVSVGASGSLFGLFGAMISEFLLNWGVYTNKCLHLSKLLFLVIVTLAFGFMPHIDNYAHIGGTITGFLMGSVLLAKPQFGWNVGCYLPSAGHVQSYLVKSKHALYQRTMQLIAFNVLIALFATSTVLLFKNFDMPARCRFCRYLDCIPSRFWICPSS